MKKNTFHFLLSLGLFSTLALLNACSNTEKPPPHLSTKSGEVVYTPPQPAVLIESNANNTQILQQAMSFALKGKKVSLHKDAFTKSPNHSLEKKPFKADGLILGAPDANRFSLFTFRDICYLTYSNGAKQIPLNAIRCKAFK